MRQGGSRYATLDGARPVIIAHRGASGYRPEHTLEGYALAIEMGADYIEPDLVITADGHLVARHDNYLSTTTDVDEHGEFQDKKRWSDKFGREDWFVEDFTLAEVKTLRARQPFGGRSKEFDGRFEIPTFEEIMALASRKSNETGRRIGVYPETKHPSYFKSLGLGFEKPLLERLTRFGYEGRYAKTFIQSFEPEILESLRTKTETRLVMLLYPKQEDDPKADAMEPHVSLEAAAGFADAVGPSKALLLGPDGTSSGFLEAAHALGLAVHPWTFRQDQLGEGFSTFEEELQTYIRLGIDGFFTDFSDAALEALDRFERGNK